MQNTISAVHRAYARIVPDYLFKTKKLEDALDHLLQLSREVESNLMRKLKPTIVLSLKWKFDYLCKTLESPFLLEKDINYWIDLLNMLKNLGELGWFNYSKTQDSSLSPWKRTAEGFDLGWTSTTAGEDFYASQQIATERLDQIIDLVGGKEAFEGKEILDSGCGPGRYVDLMLKLNPKSILAMDQGERLVNVVTKRFEADARVKVEKGTCEKLTYKNDSFDVVFSNGVLHHTPSDLEIMLQDHARVLRKNGFMFIMLVGRGGLELKMWEFARNFLYDIPMPEILSFYSDAISSLRMQGIVDHMYGEYQQTSRETFEQWCSSIFTKIERVPGIEGLDVTPEIYKDDPYFDARFGSGHLRYICWK